MIHHFSPLRTTGKGFTLIELMVTMAVSSVLMITLAALVFQATDGYALTQRSVDHLSQARAFLQLMESDFSTRVPETPMIHESDESLGPDGSDRISLVRTLSPDEQHPEIQGDLATCCYYVAFTEDPNQRIIPKLFRKILNPSETQSLMESGDAGDYPDVDPSVDEAVMDCVLGFHATLMYHDQESGNDERWDRNVSHPPSHIKIMLRTLDESFASRFTNRAAWDRLAISPTEDEENMIRSVSHRIAIGK